MTVEIQPEDERLIDEKLRSGAFDSVDEVIHRALVALLSPDQPHSGTARKSLVQLFAESPLKGLDLDFSRGRSTARAIDLNE